MMTKSKYFTSVIILGFIAVGSIILIDGVFAKNEEALLNIQYPVEELGNCQDKTACRSYCDKSENAGVCVDFAEKNNLMSEKEIDLARKFMAAGNKGPGDCKGKDKCEAFCDDIANIDECVSFAEKNGLMEPEELEEAKKVKAAIDRGVKPPSCRNKKECDVYCGEPEHMEECIAFGIEAGFIQGKELEDVQRMLAAIKKGVKPPPCRGKEACDKYCGNPDNMEVCMNFAIEAGFMNEQEITESRKFLEAIKKGVKPPKCRGREECDTYCSQDEHFEECFQFAEAAGFMTPEEAKMARKTGGKGPGGCKGKDKCEAFCNNPDNQEVCFNFAKENGMIPEEDLKQMEEGKQKFKESLEQAPQVVIECLNSQLGTDMMEKMKSGAVMPSREIGDKMRECFEKMGPPGPGGEGGSGAGGMIPPAGQTGPGGCKTKDECKAYCESNPDECQKFQPGPGEINPGDQIMSQQAGPGGCKGPEECDTYCQSNPDECKNFGVSGKQQFAPGTGPSSGPNNCQNPEECQQMQKCEGENCLQGPPPNQPGEYQPPKENNQTPGEQQPHDIQIQPIEQQLQQSAPSETPPPPPISNTARKSLLGSLLNLFLSLFKR